MTSTKIGRWAARAVAVLAAGALSTIGVTGTASAGHQEYTMIPGHTYSLGEANNVLCAGQITTNIRTPHDRAGTASVSMGWAPYFTSPCSVVASVNWHNLDTGERGTTESRLTTSGRGPLPPPITDGGYVQIPTAPGRVVFTITSTSLNYVAAPPIEVVVPR